MLFGEIHRTESLLIYFGLKNLITQKIQIDMSVSIVKKSFKFPYVIRLFFQLLFGV